MSETQDCIVDQKPQTSRAVQKAETRARILDCAIKAFATFGYDASVRDIAAEADVRHSTVRYHFKNKEGLWAASIEFLFGHLEEGLKLTDQEMRKPSVEIFRLLIERYVRYCAEYPEHARIMAHESMRDSERFAATLKTYTKPSHERIGEFLKSLADKKAIPDISTVSLIYALVGVSQTPFVLGSEIRNLYGMDVFHEHFVDAHAEAVYRLFIR
ncbi:MAG: TetR family transcriptional regulator [Pseudomonadota bacterium]